MAWKVPSQGMPSTTPPIRSPMRDFISRAALLVKVTARICDGRARPKLKIWAMRVVSTRVLPVPAPGQHQQRAVKRLDRLALLLIERIEIMAGSQPHGALRRRKLLLIGRGQGFCGGGAILRH